MPAPAHEAVGLRQRTDPVAPPVEAIPRTRRLRLNGRSLRQPGDEQGREGDNKLKGAQSPVRGARCVYGEQWFVHGHVTWTVLWTGIRSRQ